MRIITLTTTDTAVRLRARRMPPVSVAGRATPTPVVVYPTDRMTP